MRYSGRVEWVQCVFRVRVCRGGVWCRGACSYCIRVIVCLRLMAGLLWDLSGLLVWWPIGVDFVLGEDLDQ